MKTLKRFAAAGMVIAYELYSLWQFNRYTKMIILLVVGLFIILIL